MTSVLGKLGGALRFLGGPWGLVISLITTAIATSKDLQGVLGGVLGQIGGALGSLVSQMAPVLSQLASTLLPVFGMIMDTLVVAFQQVLTAVLPIIGDLAAILIGQLLPPLLQLVVAVLPVVVTLFGVVVKAVAALLPPVLSLATFLAGLLVPVISVLAGVLGWVANLISTVVFASISWLATSLMPMLNTAIQATGSFFVWLWQSVLVPAWQGIINAINTAWNGFILPIFNAIGAFVRDVLAPIFTWLWESIITPIWTGILMLITGVGALLIVAWQLLVAFVRDVLAPIFTWLWESVILPVWTWISNTITQVVNWIWHQVLEPLIVFLRDVFTAAWNIMRDSISAVWDWISGKINAVVTWVRDSILTPLVNWVNTVFVQRWQQMKMILGLIWEAIKFSIDRNVAFVRDWILTPISNWINTVFIQGWNRMKDGIVRVWEWVKGGIRSGVDFIRNRILNPLSDWLQNTFVAAWTKTKDGITSAWNRLRDAVKKPVEFVVNKVVNPFIQGYNNLNDFWSGDDLKKLSLGFRVGGYTGNGGIDDPAGVVHGREFVIRSEATRKLIETHGLAALDHLNRTGDLAGAAAMSAPAPHGARGAAAGGPPSGPSGIWGPLQAAIASSGRFYVPRQNFLGVNTADAASAWMGRSAVDVRVGRGYPGITSFIPGGAGGWGFNSGSTVWMQPGVPANRRLGVLVHELGHALSLHHTNSTHSVMHPLMRGGDWPTSLDTAALQRAFGAPGGKTKTYNHPGGGGGGGFFSLIADKVRDFISGKVKGLINVATSAFGSNRFLQLPLGLAKKTFDSVANFVTGGAAADGAAGGLIGGDQIKPTLFDGGGWLENTGQAQLVSHQASKPDAVLSWSQWQAMMSLADHVAGGGETRIEQHLTVQERPERSPEHMAHRIFQDAAQQIREELSVV